MRNLRTKRYLTAAQRFASNQNDAIFPPIAARHLQSVEAGPFRLAWYEALLRIGDSRASKQVAGETQLDSVTDVSSSMEFREESPSYADTPPLSAAEQSLVADLVADGLSIQEKFRPEPLFKQTGKGHYESDTVEEVKRAKEQSRGTQKS